MFTLVIMNVVINVIIVINKDKKDCRSLNYALAIICRRETTIGGLLCFCTSLVFLALNFH